MTFIKRVGLSLLLLSLNSCAENVKSDATHAALTGIYATTNTQKLDQSKIKQALSNPNVDGFFIHATWQEIEPKPDVFDWSAIDRQLAILKKFNKKASIAIIAGAYAPPWLAEKGVKFMATKVVQRRQKDFCQPLNVPIPWDEIFLQRWTSLIKQFGRHYADNPLVSAIKITGIASRTAETALPANAGGIKSADNGENCHLPDDVRNWQKLGYTSEKVTDAFTSITKAFVGAFPDSPLVLMTDNRAFPPLNMRGELDPSAVSLATTTFLQIGEKLAGKRFIAQNNGLTALKVDPGIKAFAEAGHTVGYQAAWPITADSRCYMSLKKQNKPCLQDANTLQAVIAQAQAGGARYIELMPVDILNPDFAGVLSKAHQYFNSF